MGSSCVSKAALVSLRGFSSDMSERGNLCVIPWLGPFVMTEFCRASITSGETLEKGAGTLVPLQEGLGAMSGSVAK